MAIITPISRHFFATIRSRDQACTRVPDRMKIPASLVCSSLSMTHETMPTTIMEANQASSGPLKGFSMRVKKST
ncbi:MAG: hypothetical protein ACD_75C02455G0001 [uncultured bacterium]|nr:MAG: hypothetical protein ACD_75C02455G0001 [uncultured bacterium]